MCEQGLDELVTLDREESKAQEAMKAAFQARRTAALSEAFTTVRSPNPHPLKT